MTPAPTPGPMAQPKSAGGFEYHPPRFEAWTDAGSLGHLLLGWFAGSLAPAQALGIFAVFSGYQISQTESGESWARVGGELLEFGLGMLAAQIMKGK